MNEIIYAGRHEMTHTVARHAHESWEFVYCTYGTGTFAFDSGNLSYTQGDIVVIPPLLPHANASQEGFRNIHINMSLSLQVFPEEPSIVRDNGNHFLLDAFTAALYHFQSDRQDRSILLDAYGNLICCYLSVYQQDRRHSPVVEDIERDILAHFEDCSYELDTYLHTLPFNYDYLRKLFQREMQVTPHQFLNSKRLQKAVEMLVATEYASVPITDVARMCGFREPLYFSRMFKKKYGVAPSYYVQFRRSSAPDQALNSDSVKVMLEDV